MGFVIENLENINPDVVESLGIDPSMIIKCNSWNNDWCRFSKMSSAISNGMNLSDALEASS